eukprot:564112-Rhodomonas_salina.3
MTATVMVMKNHSNANPDDHSNYTPGMIVNTASDHDADSEHGDAAADAVQDEELGVRLLRAGKDEALKARTTPK